MASAAADDPPPPGAGVGVLFEDPVFAAPRKQREGAAPSRSAGGAGSLGALRSAPQNKL